MRVADASGRGRDGTRAVLLLAIGVGEPDEIARIAAERMAEGYPRLQIKVGGRPVEMDIEVMRKVWDGCGARASGWRSMATAA